MVRKKIMLSIVVPCYNEAKNISLLLDRFKKVIERDDVEVILVDNGSTDESAKVIAKLLPEYKFARTVRVPVNQGYGFGIISGLRVAEGKFLGWTHADMQTDPADTIKALQIIEKYNYDADLFIKGKRLSRPAFDLLFTIGMGAFESLILGLALFDINGQPTIFSRNFYESWNNPPADFSLDLYAYALAKKRRLKIVRLPVHFTKRINGASSWNTGLKSKIKLINRTISFSWRLRREIKNNPGLRTDFIAHRINTIDELKKLPRHLGVELDLRDRDDGRIIMKHDPFEAGEDFEKYLKCYEHGMMILNIKSERIEHKVLELLKKYDIKNYFFLDSSFPMIHLLSREGERNIALRYSDYEGIDTILSMQGRVGWVWVDCFSKFPLDRDIFDRLKSAGFKLCLVSPELQGRNTDVELYKEIIKKEGIIFDAICTKSYNVERWR